VLDDLGLVPALEALAEGIAQRTRRRVKVEGRRDERLPAPIETTLYRFNNASRHGCVTVPVDRSGPRYCAPLPDNGVGLIRPARRRPATAAGDSWASVKD